jgi:diguanylate cyclase (GGDEF)-like protein
MATSAGSVARVARLRLLVPFALMTLLAVLLASPNAGSHALWEDRAAGALTLGLVVIGFAVPWRRLPTWTHPAVPLGYFVVIALLRDANGGAPSGYGPLCVMPVFWLALFGTRRQLAVGLAAVATLFTAPIVFIGGDRYPASEWRAMLLWTLVLTIVGYRVNVLVGEVKRRARITREHAILVEQHVRDLADTQASLQAMAQLAREVSSAPNARDLICEAAVSGSGAALATLVEPDGQGGFSVTGTAGIAEDLERVQAEVRPNASLRAFYSRERLFIADTSDQAAGLSPFLIEAAGVQSVVFEPIVRHEQPVGVLCVGWNEPRAELDNRTSTVISYLAAEAGAAIERADLVAQLDELARTDQLTDLPNRRSWVQHLQAAVDAGRGRRGQPFCVAILDLDHFKHYNDRYGHQAGDALLAEVGNAWRGQLRANDLIARYGGEEFAVLLPACSLDEATQVLERLRSATPSVTCSAGLAEHRPDETAEELTRRADRALYLAKRNGRNQLIAA